MTPSLTSHSERELCRSKYTDERGKDGEDWRWNGDAVQWDAQRCLRCPEPLTHWCASGGGSMFQLVENLTVFEGSVSTAPHHAPHVRKTGPGTLQTLRSGLGMGACTGAVRRRVHFPPVLQGLLSGHPPGKCLAHPHLIEMPINPLQP